MKERWEYRQARPWAISLMEDLNKLGKEGWEFCCDLAPNSAGHRFLFKRKIEPTLDECLDEMDQMFDELLGDEEC